MGSIPKNYFLNLHCLANFRGICYSLKCKFLGVSSSPESLGFALFLGNHAHWFLNKKRSLESHFKYCLDPEKQNIQKQLCTQKKRRLKKEKQSLTTKTKGVLLRCVSY